MKCKAKTTTRLKWTPVITKKFGRSRAVRYNRVWLCVITYLHGRKQSCQLWSTSDKMSIGPHWELLDWRDFLNLFWLFYFYASWSSENPDLSSSWSTNGNPDTGSIWIWWCRSGPCGSVCLNPACFCSFVYRSHMTVYLEEF